MDGTTATNLAPSEDEMSKTAEVFAKMRDAVIDASKLAGEVASLRGEVESVRNEVNHLRDTNRWMDSQITELRIARDAAIADRSSLADALNSTRSELVQAQAHANNQSRELARLNEQITTLRKERDDAQYEAMSMSEHAQDLEKKLGTIEAVFGKPVESKPVEQPRDPVTQQWKSPGAEPEREEPRYDDEGGKGNW
jgi:chromosome segregation ATPase